MAHARLDAIDIALQVADGIEAVGGFYFIGGSLASSLQGEPRATNDIDMVIELPLGRIALFVKTLGGDFEIDLEMLRDALLHGGSCNIFHLPTMMKIDLFAVGPTAYDAVEFARRGSIQVRPSGESLVLKTPEDTVLRKLMWFQQGGRVSDRQWRDVVAVLKVSGDMMDVAYMNTWALRLGIADLLAKASEAAR